MKVVKEDVSKVMMWKVLDLLWSTKLVFVLK